MKAIPMLLAFAVCTLCGRRMAGRLQGRNALLSVLAHDMEVLSAAALRTRRPLLELLSVCLIDAQTKTLLQAYCMLRKTNPHQEAWEKTVQQQNAILAPLQADECALLAETLRIFTSGDPASLQKQTEALLSLFRERGAAAAKDAKEKGKLYRSVGLLLGAALAIIMI